MPKEMVSSIRTPVKRENAERFVLLSLVSFASTVILTRGFLALTGYPQLGGGELHIAHVLWGGLFLFVGGLFPLILANRWALNYSAILNGIGMGLFIDEVGKFITQNNDYFYPPAAPIIYSIFLLTVLVYLQVRKPPSRNSRAEMYRVLEGITEILDGDLEPAELHELKARLQQITLNISTPDAARLANDLMQYFETHEFRLNTPQPGKLQRIMYDIRVNYERYLTRKLSLSIIAIGFLLFATANLIQIFTLILIWFDPNTTISDFLYPLVMQAQVRNLTEAYMMFARIGLDAVIAFVLIVAFCLILIKKVEKGINLGSAALLISLVVLNLLVFYIDQFQAVFRTLLYLSLFSFSVHFRRRYIKHSQ